MQQTKRLNWNVPTELAPRVQMLADMDGVPVPYWLRKAIEQAIEQAIAQQQQKLSG